MKLLSLDKKHYTIEFKLEIQRIANLLAENKITEIDLLNDVKRQLYEKFTATVAKQIKTEILKTETEVFYKIEGYVLSNVDMLNIMKECLEMDDRGREIMMAQINKSLGIIV